LETGDLTDTKAIKEQEDDRAISTTARALDATQESALIFERQGNSGEGGGLD
jgi:hypothetical protein